ADEEDPLLIEARRLADPLQTEPFLFETAPTTLPAPAPPPSPFRRRGSGRVMLATFLIGIGVVALVAILAQAGWFAIAAGVLMAVGAALIVGGFTGGGRWLVFPALVVLAIMSFGSAVPLDEFGLTTGERHFEPVALANLEESYRLGAGEMTIDLSAVDFADVERTVEAKVGLGELTVIVPREVDVEVEGSVGAGSLVLFGDESDGVGVRDTAVESGTTGGTLRLEIGVGLGEATVERAATDKPMAPERPEQPGGEG
ncbi:MAG: LiaF domain-containing protein, partial [Acidimicrobiales bacterium]